MDNISFKALSAGTFFSGRQIEKAQESLRVARNGNEKDLKKTCSDMESLFIFQLFKEMRATIPKSEFLDGGKGEEIYTLMLDSNMAKEIASGQGIGLASILYDQLNNTVGNIKNKDSEK